MSVDDPSDRIEVPLLYAHIADARANVEDESARQHLEQACEQAISLEEQAE